MAPRKSERRSDALSRERIIAAAIALLDRDGEDGLTFRALTDRLDTGPGAIYWHVANKDELLAHATEAVMTETLAGLAVPGAPRDHIRAVALALFDAIDAHPWLAAQLSAQMTQRPSQAVEVLERLGRQVQALGVPPARWFTATFALLYYILGAAGQNAANGRAALGVDRDTYLAQVSDQLAQLDPGDYAFTRAIAGQVRDHDDRDEFLAGVDLILAGIVSA